MCKYAKESKARELIVGTESGILHRLRKENPNKKFFPITDLAICPNMKLNTLEKILWSLQDMKHEIKIPQNIRLKAINAVDKMLEIS
jgi:quinolinate synthase